MKAQNLRIGNYIKAKGLICEIVSINKDEVQCQCFKDNNNEHISLVLADIQSIPLNEKVLKECCGFDTEKRLVAKNTYLQYTPNNDHYIILENDKKESLIHFWDIKTLHQLQNLYYALAGTELIIALSCLTQMLQ